MTSLVKEVSRPRFLYAGAIVLTLVSGLLWRSSLLQLSPFWTKYGGDALWSLLVFFGFGFLFPRLAILRIAALALAFAWSVEFLQLYHAPWIDSIRSTLPGRLVLGSTFNWPDLPAYVVGIGLGLVLETFWLKSQK